ncbi:hypothetical protein HanXRQr2_Chr15g0717951 [Helianthus annuus]|uniref:Uncharacterized protein n=1 Tax=Helianthus annuus TaxID=4232 RepID=A0A9K3H6F3_HELAN|nr:hypothetical protein HanXRQr2_Chr15g0717951 [Helianthus annuus]KAJ0833308.1 hypothetical protein HanPSC8_Chr15g0688801 [Helianthus annuus]
MTWSQPPPTRVLGDREPDLKKKPKYLVTFTVGWDQRDNIDAAVKGPTMPLATPTPTSLMNGSNKHCLKASLLNASHRSLMLLGLGACSGCIAMAAES